MGDEESQLAKLVVKLAIDMRDMKEQAQQAQESNKTLTETIKGSWTELKSQVDLVGEYFGTIQQALDATVGKTVEYAEQVREMMRDVGGSAEDASKLIQAADDVNVSFEEMQIGMRVAIRNGIEPTMEGMARLADQYTAIQDPVERTRFLLTTFGESGAKMGALMELGADGIRESGRAAEEAGLVMSGDAVKAAREYEIALDDLGDTTDALAYKVGNTLIPVLTSAIHTGLQLVSWNKDVRAALDEHKEAVMSTSRSYDEYVAEMRRAAQAANLIIATNGDLYDFQGKLVQQNYLASEGTWTIGKAYDMTGQAIDNWAVMAKTQGVPTAQTLAKAQDDLKGSLDLVLGSTKEMTKEMLYQKAAQNLDADAALALGRNMGVINEMSWVMLDQLQKLREKYDSNRDGMIDATEAAAGYTAEVAHLYSIYNNLTDKTVHINVVTDYSTADEYREGHANDENGDVATPYATGGSFTVPGGYDNDSYLARFGTGERVDVSRPQDATRGEQASTALLSEIRGLREDLRASKPAIDYGQMSRSMRDSLLGVFQL